MKFKKNHNKINGILINAGALSHYSYALLDALVDSGVPFISVHLSDIKNRDTFRQHDVFKQHAVAVISGKKEQSYLIGLEMLVEHLKKI